MEAELSLPCDYVGTLRSIVDDLSERYILRFFGEIWKPRTGDYEHTGWDLADEINGLNPERVLDVGCGYHPFKGRIPNIVGIDPYNDQADYMVDILDFHMHRGQWDAIIALGSINFNTADVFTLGTNLFGSATATTPTQGGVSGGGAGAVINVGGQGRIILASNLTTVDANWNVSGPVTLQLGGASVATPSALGAASSTVTLGAGSVLASGAIATTYGNALTSNGGTLTGST